MWALLEPVFRAGETFPHDPSITETEARRAWVEQSQAVMVAVEATGALVGTYYLRPNSLALGAHVANAGYVVAEHCRRQGIGSRLCQHSLQAARRLGFRAMQFNLVVSTNTAGLLCWQRNGFQVVGTLPGAFRHGRLGYVDALVMVQGLMEAPHAHQLQVHVASLTEHLRHSAAIAVRRLGAEAHPGDAGSAVDLQ